MKKLRKRTDVNPPEPMLFAGRGYRSSASALLPLSSASRYEPVSPRSCTASERQKTRRNKKSSTFLPPLRATPPPTRSTFLFSSFTVFSFLHRAADHAGAAGASHMLLTKSVSGEAAFTKDISWPRGFAFSGRPPYIVAHAPNRRACWGIG